MKQLRQIRPLRGLKIHWLGICLIISITVAAFLIIRPPQLGAQVAQSPLTPLKAGDPMPADLFVQLAKAVSPTVINISTTQWSRPPHGRQFGHPDPFFDLFQQFMNPNPFHHPKQPKKNLLSLGSGFIISKDGLAITNSHVVDKADEITVQLLGARKKTYKATIVGRDPSMDIALIKINGKKGEIFPVAQMGDSDKLQVGQWVLAVGNPFGHNNTMTVGIISAKNREISELNSRVAFLQTDASINPGNSGGPLFDTTGRAIGVNAAIDPRAQNIGFVIPITPVKNSVEILKKGESIKRSFVGVMMQNLNEESAKSLGISRTDGALITQIVPGSPAEKGGIKPYDLVIKFGSKKVNSIQALIRAVSNYTPGEKVKVKVVRNKKEKILTVQVGQHPDDIEQQAQKGRSKRERGQKAPFGLGFKISNYSKKLAKEMGLFPLREKHPVVVEVNRGGVAFWAGLAPGDIILDVNRKIVRSSREVIKYLLKDRVNIMRVLKQNGQVVLLYLKPR